MRQSGNWRVLVVPGRVVLIDPGRRKHIFTTGEDPFWDAINHAAKILRGDDDEG